MIGFGRTLKPMSRRWKIAPVWDQAANLADELGCSTILAQLLFNRKISDAATARKFLTPKLSDLYEPDLLPEIALATERIIRAITNQEKIVIYGDYDVDGITGTAILWHCLKLAGANVDFYVPHRVDEGYGLNQDAIRKIAIDGAKLIVTVDCGITAHEEAKLANEIGVDLIITDHHHFEEPLPVAVARVHPRLPGSDYPNGELSGSAVAFKLAWAVAQRIGNARKVSPQFRDFLISATSMAALGTIADVVPLSGENRIISTYGLAGLKHSNWPGVAALIESAGLSGEQIDSMHVGFSLAPRLNAAGRMGHARLAVELFTRADHVDAKNIADYLEQQNRQRQKVEREIVKQARQEIQSRGWDSDDHYALVLASEQWHAGVIGIVASRMVDRFGRPTVIISITDDGASAAKAGQGSARSIANFSMIEALGNCSEHLRSFGGHAMAGGLRIDADRIETFREAFCDHARSVLANQDLRPKLDIDAEVSLGMLDEPLVRDMARLGPFGCANPRPLLCARNLKLAAEPRIVGKTGETVQLIVDHHGFRMKAVGFKMARLADDLSQKQQFHAVFEPSINEFNGRRNVEMILRDVQFEGSINQ